MSTLTEKVMKKKAQILRAHPNYSKGRALKEAWAATPRPRGSGVKKKAAKKRKVGAVKKRKVGSVKKRASPKRKRVAGVKKRIVRSTRTTTTAMTGMGAIKSQARQTKKALEDKLGKEMVKQYNTKGVTAKRKGAKKVSAIKQQISSVNKIINQKAKK
jgi:hypothetical protein